MLFIPCEIQFIIETLQKNGFEAYLVGGCVRDMLTDITPHDYDITTSAPPEATVSLFERTVPTGIKHGTVTVLHGGFAAEVTTYRTDGEYGDHRRPESVTFVKTLREDLARRDFTVNAIAYNKHDGIIDYFGGICDIKNKCLRAVGEPERRFTEDALRILRLFRFASVLDFTPEEATVKAALDRAPLLKSISAERISSELKKAVNGTNPMALKPLTDVGALEFFGVEGPDYSRLIPLQQSDLSLFGFLYSSCDNPLRSLEFLKPSNKEKKLAENLIKLLSMPFPEKKSELKELLFISDIISVEKYLSFQKGFFGKKTDTAEKMLDEITDNNEPYKISQLKTDGKALMKLGISGAEIGETLEYLRKCVVNDPTLNRRGRLLEIAEDYSRK